MTKFRKVFNYKNLNEYKIIDKNNSNIDEYFDLPITACGCLFYRTNDDSVQFLLIKYNDKNWNKLDDFGGKVDLDDNSVYDTIFREVEEETNKVIDKEMMIDLTNESTYTTFYNKKSKYFSIAIEIDNYLFNNCSVFGNYEFSDKIYRKINWYDYDKCKNDLCLRLSNNYKFVDFFDNLKC